MADSVQYIYLDFDGERTTFRNQDLRLSLSVSVRDPGFSDSQKQAILSALRTKYASDGIVFTLSEPDGGSYSTLYFGTSDSFARYGNFYGVAETRDDQNRRTDDNAFVLLDSSYSTDQIVSVSGQVLDHILGKSLQVDGMDSLRDYAANACMLSTTWSQRDPYNKYCPVDPATQKRSVAGCTNIAVAQLIYYWVENGSLDLTLTVDSTDAYTKNGITIDETSANASKYGYLSFSETNKLLSSFQLGSSDCIAALCFAAGVIQQASYSSDATATPYLRSVLTRAGFANGITEYYSDGTGSAYFLKGFGGLTDSGFALLVNELLDGRPVLASVYYGNGKDEGEEEHAVVIDGYNSSSETFHLNFGWGGQNNGWYTRDELNDYFGIYDMFTGITPNLAPRLAVQKFTSKADAVNRDDYVTLYFSVTNQGRTKSNAVTATFYCGRRNLGTVSVDSVSAGGAGTLSLTFSASMLSLGANTITVRANSKGVSRILSASQTVTVYDGAVTDADDSWKAVSAEAKWKFTATYDDEGTMAETVLAKNEYIGWCDTADYRELTLDHPGKYTFTLSGLTGDLELDIYSPDAAGSKLKLCKSAVLHASSKGIVSDVPLEKGTYYIAVKAVNAESHGASDYGLTVSGTGYLKANNIDDWTDLADAGAEGTVLSAGLIDGETTDVVTDEWVGLGDEFDYRLFLIPCPAKVSFRVTASDAVKFTVYEIREKVAKDGTVTYSLKSLQSTKFNAGKTESTKGLLLSDGNTPGKYCFSVQSTNAAKGGSADYSVTFDHSVGVFYSKGDNSDDWGDLASEGAGGAVGGAIGIAEGDVELFDGWVGFRDEIDYRAITVASGAKLSFSLGATDATKFTVWKLVPKKGKNDVVTYSLKSVQGTKLSKDKKTKTFAATTKTILLDEGTYYVSMASTNASKGGSADYTVELNGGDSVFYVYADGRENDRIYDKKFGSNDAVVNADALVLHSGMSDIRLDADAPGLEGWNNFVGYGDEADCRKIRLDADATLSFTATATDATKFVIFQLTEKNGKTSLKTVQKTKLSKQKNGTEYTAETKPVELAAGEYYLSMQSTNAKKGGNACYNVSLNLAACDGLPEAPLLSDAQLAFMPDADDPVCFDMPAAADSVAGAFADISREKNFGETDSGILACL